jgi:hypothetical protein
VATAIATAGVCGLAGIVAITVNSRKTDPTRRPAAQVATAGPGLDRNLLAPGRFQTGSGWVVPDEARKTAYEHLRLRPGQIAYRDLDLTAFSGRSGTPLAISAGARVQYSWQAKAALGLWAEPSGKLLGEDTRSANDTTRVIGRTIPLPRDTTTVRLVLYGLASGPRSQEPNAQVTYYDPEFVVHEPGRLPVFAQLALGQSSNTTSARETGQRQATAAPSPFVPLYKRRRPSPPAPPQPAATTAPIVTATTPRPPAAQRQAPATRSRPQVIVGGRSYVMETSRPLALAADRPTPRPTPTPSLYRYDPRPTAYQPEPSATPLDFPSAWTYRTQIWIPNSADTNQPAAPAPHWGR